MKPRALVSGALGFLGRATTEHLVAAGWEVIGIGHGMATDDAHLLSRWHVADLTLDALVTYANEPDAIVHCAGSGSVPFSMTHPLQDFTRTVCGTAAVLEYVRLHSPTTRVVYPSSAAVYGVVEHLPISEDRGPAPASPYGTHKLMAEALCRSFACTYGVAVSIIRFFSIYGEGLRKQLLWDACNRLEASDYHFSGTGTELRDWLHAEDAARLVGYAIDRASPSCPIVNGASGSALTIANTLEQVSAAWGSTAAPMFSGTRRPGDPPGYLADTSLARSWGWTPSIDFADGVRRYVDWFRSTR